MDSKLADLEEYFCNTVLTSASRLQSTNGDPIENSTSQSLSLTFSCEKFGEELLKCIERLPASQVIHLIITIIACKYYRIVQNLDGGKV